jgi:hypothetical protein
MMTAFETTYRYRIRESNLISLGVAKPLKKLVTQCILKKFIKNLSNEIDHTTDKAGPLFQNMWINSLTSLCVLFN